MLRGRSRFTEPTPTERRTCMPHSVDPRPHQFSTRMHDEGLLTVMYSTYVINPKAMNSKAMNPKAMNPRATHGRGEGSRSRGLLRQSSMRPPLSPRLLQVSTVCLSALPSRADQRAGFSNIHAKTPRPWAGWVGDTSRLLQRGAGSHYPRLLQMSTVCLCTTC
jgi:hypothetical protein